MRSADTELQSTLELRAKALKIAAPKPDLDAKGKKHDFEALFKRVSKEKSPVQITLADMMQPLHYDLRCPAAKDNSIYASSRRPSILDAAIAMRSADTGLQNTLELRAKALKIAAPKPDLDAKGKKTRF